MTVNNVTTVADRYVEFFNSHNTVRNKLAVCNDLFNEHRDMVFAAMYDM